MSLIFWKVSVWLQVKDAVVGTGQQVRAVCSGFSKEAETKGSRLTPLALGGCRRRLPSARALRAARTLGLWVLTEAIQTMMGLGARQHRRWTPCSAHGNLHGKRGVAGGRWWLCPCGHTLQGKTGSRPLSTGSFGPFSPLLELSVPLRS